MFIGQASRLAIGFRAALVSAWVGLGNHDRTIVLQSREIICKAKLWQMCGLGTIGLAEEKEYAGNWQFGRALTLLARPEVLFPRPVKPPTIFSSFGTANSVW